MDAKSESTVILGNNKIQNKTVNILRFERNFPNLSKLFNDLRIMRLKDIVTLNNCILVHDQTKVCLATLKNTSVKRHALLDMPIKNTSRYQDMARTLSHPILDWNFLIKKVKLVHVCLCPFIHL